MKFSIFALAALSPLTTWAGALVPRQSSGPVGYASLNGGTTGGAGGKTVTVSTYADLVAAVEDEAATIVYVKGKLSGPDKIRVGSNKSILGLDSSSGLNGDAGGDAIGVQESTNIWIDHCDLSSDLDSGKDYYDGLADFSHGADWITVSNTYFHDHFKASLVGHSDNNAKEDKGKLHITYANNYWKNINSRMPLLRFGTAHVFNSVYDGGSTAVNARMGAQALVESTVFTNVERAILSIDSKEVGYAVSRDIILNGATDEAPRGTLTSVPYSYSVLGSANVVNAVVGKAGNTLKLG
ncbi:putative pectate lyase [Hortaea werneckii]|nr:putative pectate lyase [Hortaea werneckii]KAI7025743.1 putative pectate lyase [Hortaea werneckii]KAI7675638.1 putative pectate lyase [Hortaea werneckii]